MLQELPDRTPLKETSVCPVPVCNGPVAWPLVLLLAASSANAHPNYSTIIIERTYIALFLTLKDTLHEMQFTLKLKLADTYYFID